MLTAASPATSALACASAKPSAPPMYSMPAFANEAQSLACNVCPLAAFAAVRIPPAIGPLIAAANPVIGLFKAKSTKLSSYLPVVFKSVDTVPKVL